MFYRLQLALACSLVGAASGAVLLWVLLLVQSYDPRGGLMPWVAAGVILYGWVFVAFAALIGTPGILWARHLRDRTSLGLSRFAALIQRVGIAALGLGAVAALGVLAVEQLRPKDPFNGCVRYRDSAASAAMGKPGAAPSIECPSQ